MNLRSLAMIAFTSVALLGCQTPGADQVLLSKKPAVELRAMQGRIFETGDRAKVMRATIATLQDQGYSIVKVESGAGSIKASKLAILEVSASVFPRGDKQIVVRANAIVKTPDGSSQVDDPAFYQQRFFEPLSKSLFLTALSEPDPGRTDDTSKQEGGLK